MHLHRRAVLIGGAASLTALSTRLDAQQSEVVVGALYPLSGASAQIGIDAKQAFETALDIVNASHDLDLPLAKTAGLPGLGGAKVRLVYADHLGDPQTGRAEAERLITQDKVAAVIGCYHSAVSATASQTAERYGVPFMCADSSSPNLQRRSLKFFFRADSANVQLKLAKERGYKVLVDIKYRANSPSLTAEVQQLKAVNADVLMPSSYTTDSILLMRTMSELGYKPKAIVAQAAGFSEQAFYTAVGALAEGVITRGSFSLDLATKRPSVGTVNDMFKKHAGKDLNDNTSRQFMAMLVFADAVNRAQATDGEKI